MTFLEQTFYGNTLQAWLAAALVFAAALGAMSAIRRFVLWRLARTQQSSVEDGAEDARPAGIEELVTHVLGRTRSWFLLLVAVYAASHLLVLTPRAGTLVARVAVIALIVQGGLWATAAITFSMARYRRSALEDDPASVTTMSAVSFVGRLVLWTLVLLLILDNLGVQVTTLLAGLGIGGIAIALAVQNILGDLFASLSIVLDKPFVIGDFLIVNEHLGAVEHIGLKTTRLRSLSGEQLVFSNSDLLNSRIRNFGRMFQRRVLFEVGVTYQTPREKLARIPELVRDSVEAQELTRFDRSHFKEYGPYSLVIETVYFVLKPDFNTYMDIQQAINLEIHRRFEAEGIEFAYPTQTVVLKGAPRSAPVAVES